MQQALRYEAEYFDEKKRLLRQIFNETLTRSADAYRAKNIPKDKFQELSLKPEDERYIRNMLDNPISIVLMGNRPCVKARIVNYILGYELLPVYDFYDPDYHQSRRSVRILYGTHRRHAFCIRHFELLDCSPMHTERVVSFDDLRLDIGSSIGSATSLSSLNGSLMSLVDAASLGTNSTGFDSARDPSATPTTISANSSCSMGKSTGYAKQPMGTGPNSSTYSSHRYQSPLSRPPLNYSNFESDDDDDDDDDLGELSSVNEMTTLEIVLPHELLEKNLQIRVAPDVENFDLIYRTTFQRTNPIIIYCFERYDERLSDVDQSHLKQLRNLMPSTPIYFAHIVDFDPSHYTCLLPSFRPTKSGCSSNRKSKKERKTKEKLPRTPSPPSTSSITSSELTESDQRRSSPPPPYEPRCGCQASHHQSNAGLGYSQVKSALSIKSSLVSSKHVPMSGRHYGQHCDYQSASNEQYLRASEALWNQLKEMGFFHETLGSSALQAPLDRHQKNLSHGYYIINNRPFNSSKQNADYGLDVNSKFICHSYEFCYFVDFFRAVLKSNLVVASTLLSELHNQFIQYFIFSAFDMTWSLNYSIPKRLEYARSKEAELYMSLMGIANRKQEEIRQVIGETLEFMRDDILTQAAAYTFVNPLLSNNQGVVTRANIKLCIEEIHEFVFIMLNRAIAVKLMNSVDVMRESFIGTLERCLKQLENYRQEINQTKNELGTDSPTKSPSVAKKEDKIDQSLSRLLNLAYSIEINTNTCNSILRIFWERIKNCFVMFSYTWRQTCVVNSDWKLKVAADLLDNLSEAKLAKCICTQFRDKLKIAHDTFVSSLGNLESILASKMKETDLRRQHVRKTEAPIFARLTLESTSFIDGILYGSPEMGKEIGRGQYGVVFSSKKSWGHYSRIAVKSIMICDDKHWNDLSMEFYYARSLPEHERIVQIRGSIVEHNHGGASSYVYLIMERLSRDLYAGLKTGLDWLIRLQIAIDVVNGLRFLHNHGLIHRDVKLKNVLLDRHNRAKVTDLGFCKSEVMISGSIVGTPIHMAPEVFTGKYDHMVDVYAFGILFWYICSGTVELPQIFEQCHNKDHLWMAVKKGLRPERLACFDDECFELMERCWAGEPTKRPLLGEVEQILLSIKLRYTPVPSGIKSVDQ